MERNLLLTICFDGGNYCGWQVQKNGNTIMRELQNAMEKVLKERPDVKGCSRTDSKVHAENYCVSFKTHNSIPPERLVTALNCKLPDDIAVRQCREVPLDFHARYSALGKTYTYRVLNSAVRNPFWVGKSMFCRYPISADSIIKEAEPFLGRHDFSAFCNIGGDTVDNIRTIYSFDAVRHGDLVELSVCGDGFLYNMVRIMMGTLV
ncbi:MAG: tRNA pseudouridine(38-40) synthase TruA, partial [Oscillospiraceae bacterium]